jgi:hypothetical protein
MRITIIPSDGFVSVDNVGYSDLDLSAIDPSVHAVQWYGVEGEVEVRNPVTRKMVENRSLTSLDEFQVALDAWRTANLAAVEPPVEPVEPIEPVEPAQEA